MAAHDKSSDIWTERYRPKESKSILGNQENVAFIKKWLKDFDNSTSKPLFIHGPPGIGKTTAAHLCCQEMGYQTLEFNASDQRNKNIIKDVISSAANNSRISFTKKASHVKDCLILDEIDGMAGNEDRGGIGQLIVELKHSKKPLIFICNDGQSQKLRALKDKCHVLEFRRPSMMSIKSLGASICQREGLNASLINFETIAESCCFDMRQIINTLSMFKDHGNPDKLLKTTRMNAFEATKKALVNERMSVEDRFECFFSDYSIMPLFIFENYAKGAGSSRAGRFPSQKLTKSDPIVKASQAADSLALSDLAEKEIRSNQNWSLLNTQALLSTVIPSKLIACDGFTRVDFPQFLGKLSNANKRLRLLQELNAHMSLKLRHGVDPETLHVLQDRICMPLLDKSGKLGGAEAVLDLMEEYSLLRDDLNSLTELASWSFKPSPFKTVDSRTKTALTNSLKKRSMSMPYFVDEKGAKKRALTLGLADDGDDEDIEEDEPIIKPKRLKT